MILVIESSEGYTIANNGQVLARLTDADAHDLRTALNQTLRPLDTGAVSPAKAAARMKPPIMRYPAKAIR